MRPLALAVLAAALLILSPAAVAQTLTPDLRYRIPEPLVSPEAGPLADIHVLPDTLDGPAHDPWFGRDKAYHLGVSFGLAVGAHVLLTDGVGLDPSVATPVAGGFAIGVGLTKEVLDSQRPVRPLFSWRDLTADAVGVALGLVVVRALTASGE